MSMTLLEVLKINYPEEKFEGIWNYRVYGPTSLDDDCAIKVRVQYSRMGPWTEFRIGLR